MSERRGDWIQTFTGRQFWPLDPRPEDVAVEDIAHALSMLCRFGGHTRFHYSVAHHSMLLSRAVPEELAPWALLHDASEAYLVDVPRPIKAALEGYAAIEQTLLRIIAERFELPWPVPPELAVYDHRILMNERGVLMATPPALWPEEGLEILPGVLIWQMVPEVVKTQFLARFRELFPQSLW